MGKKKRHFLRDADCSGLFYYYNSLYSENRHFMRPGSSPVISLVSTPAFRPVTQGFKNWELGNKRFRNVFNYKIHFPPLSVSTYHTGYLNFFNKKKFTLNFILFILLLFPAVSSLFLKYKFFVNFMNFSGFIQQNL